MNNPPNLTSLSKLLLQRINARLAEYNNNRKPNIWNSIYKWNYDYNLMKNILRISNKVLIQLNKHHVFKKDYLYLLLGLGLGHLAKEIENTWDKVQKIQIQPLVADILIEKVLKNENIRLKLQDAVDSNVLKNQDIQTNLHFILINKLLVPQTDNIKGLVNNAVLSLLRSQQIFKLLETQTVKGISRNKQIIAREALNFVNSEEMMDIIKTQVAPLIKGQMVQKTASRQLVKFVNFSLQSEQNKQKVYEFLRQKII